MKTITAEARAALRNYKAKFIMLIGVIAFAFESGSLTNYIMQQDSLYEVDEAKTSNQHLREAEVLTEPPALIIFEGALDICENPKTADPGVAGLADGGLLGILNRNFY